MGPGGFDMQQIFAAAQQALSAQQELANSELVGTAGNGAVRAVVSGVGQLLDVTIDPSVIDPTDPAETASTKADLVLAAVRDAWAARSPSTKTTKTKTKTMRTSTTMTTTSTTTSRPAPKAKRTDDRACMKASSST
jgi:nucleoid-associated protein EbfC